MTEISQAAQALVQLQHSKANTSLCGVFGNTTTRVCCIAASAPMPMLAAGAMLASTMRHGLESLDTIRIVISHSPPHATKPGHCDFLYQGGFGKTLAQA